MPHRWTVWIVSVVALVGLSLVAPSMASADLPLQTASADDDDEKKKKRKKRRKKKKKKKKKDEQEEKGVAPDAAEADEQPADPPPPEPVDDSANTTDAAQTDAPAEVEPVAEPTPEVRPTKARSSRRSGVRTEVVRTGAKPLDVDLRVDFSVISREGIGAAPQVPVFAA